MPQWDYEKDGGAEFFNVYRISNINGKKATILAATVPASGGSLNEDGSLTYTMVDNGRNANGTRIVMKPGVQYEYQIVAARDPSRPPCVAMPSDVLYAPAVKGYRFLGWYRGTEKLTGGKQYTFVIHENVDLTAKYEVTGRVSLTISCAGVFTVNGDTRSSADKTDYPLGSTVTIAMDNPNFAYWTNSYGMILSRSASYTFTVNGSDTITAVIDTLLTGKATLTFESAYGQILARMQLPEGGQMNIPSLPYYNGYTALGWDMNGDGIYDNSDTLAAAISRGLPDGDQVARPVTILPIYQLNDASYTINVTGGTGSGTYRQNAEVTVRADAAPEGKQFLYWKDADGREISYNARFTFFADKDWDLTAVYANVSAAGDAKGITLITGMSKNTSDRTMTIVSLSTVPDGFTIESSKETTRDTNAVQNTTMVQAQPENSTANSVSTSNSVVTSTVKPQAEQSSEPIRITDNSGDAIGSGHGEDAFGVLDHQNPETNADTAGSTDASELPAQPERKTASALPVMIIIGVAAVGIIGGMLLVKRKKK